MRYNWDAPMVELAGLAGFGSWAASPLHTLLIGDKWAEKYARLCPWWVNMHFSLLCCKDTACYRPSHELGNTQFKCIHSSLWPNVDNELYISCIYMFIYLLSYPVKQTTGVHTVHCLFGIIFYLAVTFKGGICLMTKSSYEHLSRQRRLCSARG